VLSLFSLFPRFILVEDGNICVGIFDPGKSMCLMVCISSGSLIGKQQVRELAHLVFVKMLQEIDDLT
jgi:hypothetical protein